MDEAVCLGNRQVLAAMIKKQYQEDLDALIAPDGSWDQLNSVRPLYSSMHVSLIHARKRQSFIWSWKSRPRAPCQL